MKLDTTDRPLGRALIDPNNKWVWCELAKAGWNLRMLMKLATITGVVDTSVVVEGYKEALKWI